MGKSIIISVRGAYAQNHLGRVTFIEDDDSSLIIKAKENLLLSFTNTIQYRFVNGSSMVYRTLKANTLLPMNNNDNISIKGDLTPTSDGIGTFSISGNFEISGNILTLINNSIMQNYSFKNLFKNCTTLIDVSNLTLPEYVTQGCYEGMFYGCTSITESPILLAETLATDCYKDMFYGCSSLNHITCLNTSDISQYVNTNWVYGVASTGVFELNEYGNWTTQNKASHIPENWNIDNGSYNTKYLTLNILTNGTLLWLATDDNNTKTISYSKDNGTTWTEITSSSEGTPINVNINDKILFKGNNTAYGSSYTQYSKFGGTAKFNAEGNIMSLLYDDDFKDYTSLRGVTYTFCSLFDASNIVSAKHLILPALTLLLSCYKQMFQNTPYLIEAPELPATTLAEECYQYMFLGASSLTTAPTLSATSLAKNCYNDMFKNCTSLTTIQNTLPATSLKTRCYCGMFVGCTALTRVSSTLLPATNMADSCYQGIFSDCTSLTTAPTFIVATTVKMCCKDMFKNCSSLTSISCSLNALQLTERCYDGMFRGCTSLTTAPSLPATSLATQCYSNMFNGCTSLTTAPDLLAKVLHTECYANMFAYCSNLNYLKCMFTETVDGGHSYKYKILYKVSDTGTLVKNINCTSWVAGDYSSQPSGWTVIDEGVAQPTISFNGEDITLECATTGATIYYQLNDTGNYIEYTGTISILSDTTIKTYAELNGDTSTTLSYICIYSPNTLLDPTISFNYGTTITLSCLTQNSTIYYRLNNTGSFIQYTEPIIINATTFIEAYSELNGSTSNIVSETFTFIDYSQQYFTIESLEDSNTISIVKAKSPSNINLSYSTDDGETWTDLTISATTNFTTINTGDKIIFKGINNRLATAWDTYYRFNGSKNFNVYGNVMSLLNGDNFVNTTELNANTDNHFVGLFYGTTTLINANKLYLSASTLYYNSYNGMFRGCTNLVSAPQIQATTCAGNECCSSMFEGCINLEVAPELNFTTLSQNCCKRMFCMDRNNKITTPKMTKSPILRCATTVSGCYSEMFKGNGNLIEVTCLKTDNTDSCSNWLSNVSSIGTFYRSPLKTNWPTKNVNGVPNGWTLVDYVEE